MAGYKNAYALVILIFATAYTVQAQNELPSTKIYLMSITKTRSGMQCGKPIQVGYHKGYNNQPYFSPDGSSILYTSNAGKGLTDIYKYNIGKKRSTGITNTPLESEYSPRYTPSEDRITCVRVEKDSVTQTLTSYDLKGKTPIDELPNVKSIGYYAWLGGSDLYTFMLPEPFSLVHYRTTPYKQELLANHIGRCIVNFRGKIFYVDKTDTSSYKLRVVSKENMRMVKNKTLNDNPIIVEMPKGIEDFAVANDGTFYAGYNGTMLSYNLRKSKGQSANSWTAVQGLEQLTLGNFNRIIFSPDNTHMAVVVPTEAKP